MFFVVIISCLLLAVTHAQQQQYTTPVPILKQIDRHNDDGSYTYGYEAADKSFKIETKYPTGEVYGKYGYVDDTGKVREIEYGASRRGFEPQGSDINVPPPTLTNTHPYPLGPNEIDDGQYREDPSVYYKDQKYNRPIAASKFRLDNYDQPRQQQNYAQPSPPQQQYSAPAYRQPQQQYQLRSQPQPQPQYQYQSQPQYQPRSYYQPQQYQQPYPSQPYPQPYSRPEHFHPAVKHIDIGTGSYSLDYTGRK